MFRIDQNDLIGSVPAALCAVFDVTEPVAFADCFPPEDPEIECPCCSYCCTDGILDGAECVCVVDDEGRCALS